MACSASQESKRSESPKPLQYNMNPKYSFLGHSAFCYFTWGVALAYPALPGSGVEGLFGFEHESGQGDLFEVYNRGKTLNRKRPPESQHAPSHMFVGAHVTDVDGYHGCQGVPIHTLFPAPEKPKRQKAGSEAYQGTCSMSGFDSAQANYFIQTLMPPGVQDGIQVCMDNMGVYQESFPWEIHENPHHERLVFGIEDTNFPPLSPSIDGASSLEEYWLSGVNFELGGTDPNVRIPTNQLAFNTFSTIGVDDAGGDPTAFNTFSNVCVGVAGGDPINHTDHTRSQHLPQFPDPCKGKSSLPQASCQDFTSAKITHEAVNSRASCLKENLEHWKPNTVDGIQNGIQEVEGRVNLTQLPSESDKEIDKFLRKISLLRRKIDMSDQFLEGFIRKLKIELGEVFKFQSNWKGESKNFSLEGSSKLRIYHNKTINLYLIRVINNSQPKTSPEGSLVFKQKKYSFTFDWLLDQTFNPGDSILPVLGATTTIQEKKMGPIQIILSIYLSGSLKSNQALGTSIDIIRFYYENIQTVDLKGVRNLDKNQISEKSLKRLIYQAIQSRLVIDDPVLRRESASSQLGNFKIHPLSSFPISMRPKDLRILYKVKLNKQEEDIINHLDIFMKGSKINHNAQNLESEKLPVSLRKLVYDAEKNQSEGYAMVTMSRKAAFGKPGLLSLIHRLMVYLKACHIGLEENFKQNQSYEEVLNNRLKFYEWFGDLLFKNKENMLPMFGDFIVKDRNYLTDPPSSSDYSEIQVLLINYFGGLLENEEIIRLALSLIGYFNSLKDQKNQVSKISTQDKKDYWNTVIEILESKFENKGRHSLKFFFEENNGSCA
ncbi:hypothetical protein Pst134EA_005332 [Puccinia striiformis f. sp. tritici]|uniref:hypothetical protein n=1 Tax=Puccinia striiformis f. sp. tritici TaxID=168172 RepID=UPI0020073B92|nr:hypothetical protein Pst134EA_005332 [Puccinia striiformis f. sp. tritici]KAH9471432.1 hypothetical protein Pst134EA_005332 [Puccinia striiformis f. sp. tritici]